MNRSLRRAANTYRYVAMTFVPAVLLLVLMNLGLTLFESFRDGGDDRAAELPEGPYFDDDGGPIANGRVHDYHITWYDKKAATQPIFHPGVFPPYGLRSSP